MANKKKAGKHTSPETAGKQNLPKDHETRYKDKRDDGLLTDLLPVYHQGMEYLQEYKGLWTDEQLAEAIAEFFDYFAGKGLKPAKVGLRLWLGVSKSQYWEWETKPEKYGYKSNLLAQAHSLIEMQYIGRIEQYPTGNVFLLKAGHGYVDKSEVEVTTNTNKPEEVQDLVSKLGLDKQKE